MQATEIIETLRSKLSMPGGRHLYGVLGTYLALEAFAAKLRDAKTPDGKRFPKPVNVNSGILETIPDDEFRQLAEHEAKRPEPTAAHIARAFKELLRTKLQKKGLLILAHLEMLFVYNIELELLRIMAADENRILLLLPGRRMSGKIIMFPGLVEENSYMLPTNLIAENHLWELRE